MSLLTLARRIVLGGAIPAVVGVVVLAGPGIGPRVFTDTRDPLPLEAVAIAIRPCELLQRVQLVRAIDQDVTAYVEGRDGDFYTCAYHADTAVITVGLLDGNSVRLNSGEDVTLQSLLDEALDADPRGSGVGGVGDGAVRTSDGTLLARQGDLVLRLEGSGLDDDSVRATARLAAEAAVDRTG